MEARLYFEAHVTVDIPNKGTEEDWNAFRDISSFWKCSKFDQDDVDGYHDKWFMSTRHNNLAKIKERIRDTLFLLEKQGFKVVRWKIEDTLLDSKYGDDLN